MYGSLQSAVFNRKWDLCHTLYAPGGQSPTGIPAAVPLPNAPTPVYAPAPAPSPRRRRRCVPCACNSPRGVATPPQKKMGGLNRLGYLGDASACVYYADDGVTVESVDQNSDPTECTANGGTWQIPPSGAAAPGVPAGSTVIYNCTFTAPSNPLKSSFYSVANVVAAVAQYLQNQWGISVTQQSSSGNIGTPTASLQVKTSVSYAQLSDLKAIIDGAFYNAAGATVSGSTIGITQIGSSASSAPEASIGVPVAPSVASTLPSWLGWAGVAVAALVGVDLVKQL